MIFDQGDIVSVDFDPTQGHEPQNTRPALVVSGHEFNKATSMTIVCPVTRTNNGFFLHEPLPENCLVEGYVVMEQVRALDLEARRATKIDHLSEQDLHPILVCVRSFFTQDGSGDAHSDHFAYATISLHAIQKSVSHYAAKYDAERVYLFGSYATGRATKKSDVDLRIDKGKIHGLKMGGLLHDLQQDLGVEVDLVSTESLDANFLAKIHDEEILIYER